MKKKIERVKTVKPELSVIIINCHTEVVTKEVADEIRKLRGLLLIIQNTVKDIER